MKAIVIGTLCALAAGFAVPCRAADQHDERIVIVSVEGLSPGVAQRVREYALKGPTELRRYLERTNMIHRLRMEDVVKQPESAHQIAQVRQRKDPNEIVVVWSKQD